MASGHRPPSTNPDMEEHVGRAACEDTVSRAVRILTSANDGYNVTCDTGARIACSKCKKPALWVNREGRMGVGKGDWVRNPDVEAMFVRADCKQISLQNEEIMALVVSSGAVVLCAQHVIAAGVEHEMLGKGFDTAFPSLTYHECTACSTLSGGVGTGLSLRLRLDALAFIDTEIKYMDTAVRNAADSDPKVRLRCGVPCGGGLCGESLNSGTLLTPPSTSTTQKPHTVQGAMGMVSPMGVLDPRAANTHGKLLYFARGVGGPSEVGVLVWVVEQRLPVVQVDDVTKLFPQVQSNYDFTSLNTVCDRHNFTFPRLCGICAGAILCQEGSQVVESISGPVHTRCSQMCQGCTLPVARMGPTPEQATDSERKIIALPAKCMRCANPSGAQTRVETTCKLTHATPGDKPGKASANMVRETALLALKRKSEQMPCGKGQFKTPGREERWIGDLKEGLWPGDSGIFRMADGTVASKTNTDGVISKKPVDGEWFRELDGGQSIYEWGHRVQYEPVHK
jgi:hypothetical protein